MKNRSSWDSNEKTSLRQWLRTLGLCLIGALGTCILYRFTIRFIVCDLIVWIGITPWFIRTKRRNMRELERFRDACLYVSQLLYSFLCTQRVLPAMEQTMAFFPDGKMKTTIYDATLLIRKSESVERTYPKAFALIEEKYGFDRMVRAHHYIRTVEELGGDFEEGIELLQRDLQIFQEKVIELQKEKRMMLSRIWMGFLVTILICGVTTRFMPQGAILAKWTFVQTAAILLIAVNLVVLVLAEWKLTGSWLKRSRNYQTGTFLTYDRRIRSGKQGLGVALARRTMRKEILEAFPGWLLDVTLLLHRGNIQTAIAGSRFNAPEVLQPALVRLNSALKVAPNAPEPYEQFLMEYDLTEIRSIMRTLYGISCSGGHNTGVRIRNLAEQNQILQRNAENSRNESSKSGLTILGFMPILVGSGKLIVDMVAFILLFIQQL